MGDYPGTKDMLEKARAKRLLWQVFAKLCGRGMEPEIAMGTMLIEMEEMEEVFFSPDEIEVTTNARLLQIRKELGK